MKIYQKLLISFSILILFSIGIGTVSIMKTDQLNQSSNDLYNKQLMPLTDLYVIENTIYANHLTVQTAKSRNQPVNFSTVEMNLTKIKQTFERFKTNPLTDKELKVVERIDKSIGEYEAYIKKSKSVSSTGQAFDDIEFYQYFLNLKSPVDQLIQTKIGIVQSITDENEKIYVFSRNLSLLFNVIVLIIGITLSLTISTSIRKKLNLLNQKVLDIAQNGGDLTQKVNLTGKDEINTLGTNINLLIDKLRDMLLVVKNNTDQVAQKANEVTDINQQSAEVTNQVAVAINDIATGSSNIAEDVQHAFEMLEMMRDEMNKATGSSERVNEELYHTNEQIKYGNQIIEEQTNLMDTNKSSILRTKQSLNELTQKLSETHKVLALIDEIAEQTNLLALNAAIEAARAGEHGRGFAVVADEVRKLAEQSAKSTQQIGKTIQEIVDKANLTAKDMEESFNNTIKQEKTVEKTNEVFQQIVSSMNEIAQKAEELSSITQRANQSTSQLAEKMESIASITEESAASAEEVSASTEELTSSMDEIGVHSQMLTDDIQELEGLIQQFKLESHQNGDIIEEVKKQDKKPKFMLRLPKIKSVQGFSIKKGFKK